MNFDEIENDQPIKTSKSISQKTEYFLLEIYDENGRNFYSKSSIDKDKEYTTIRLYLPSHHKYNFYIYAVDSSKEILYGYGKKK